MPSFIKYLFAVIGGVLIGLGLGIFVCQNAMLAKKYYQIAMLLGLVTGGFFLALGMPGKKPRNLDKDLYVQ
jgi:hypothetical protein